MEVTNRRKFAENAPKSAKNMKKKFQNLINLYYNLRLFDKIKYCKNYETNLIFPSYLCMTFIPWIRIRIGFRKERRQNPDPKYKRCLSTSLV